MWWGSGPSNRSPEIYLNTAPVKEGTTVAWFDFGGAEAPDEFDPTRP